MSPSRDRCYGCFRPIAACFCNDIPNVDNTTEILILQHSRERNHPFNTARILHRALAKSELFVGYPRELSSTTLPILDNAGLLYPSNDATDLASLDTISQLKQLVVIDGTWHHAKTIFRDVPAIQRLPRFKISPSSPGQYRIRREPNSQSLSTLEATAAALKALEPDLEIDALLNAFDSMVTTQLSHPNQKQAWRSKTSVRNASPALPSEFSGNLDSFVVAYGEMLPGRPGERRRVFPPILWIAKRLATGDSFRQTIRPTDDFQPSDLTDTDLTHMKLTRDEFEQSLSISEFREAWRRFVRPSDRLFVYHKSSLRQLMYAEANFTETTVLKPIKRADTPNHATLEEIIVAENIVVDAANHSDRATRRLEKAAGYVRHLHRLRTLSDA
ncbi:MAG: DTW domain-containing protein [Planctomycetales bacterium]|nr:DTW domain-containing protein [Planctomycetales bacterium]